MTPLGWRLTAAQWDVLTAALHLNGYPAPLQVGPPGPAAGVERDRLRADAGNELKWLGLVRAGRVDADLEAALRLLNRPVSWLDSVWLSDAAAEQPVRVVAARGATMGVCALQHPDRPGATVVDIIPAVGLAAAVVSRLPPHPPGHRPSVIIDSAPSPGRTTQSAGGVLVSASPARTSAERDSLAVSAILDRPHARAGQIGANVRDSSGQVRRSQVLRWCDNPDGRYLVTVSQRTQASRSLTVSPCDAPRLGDEVQRLLDALQPS
ncbi:MAG: ESX secretion-associated protein EspG [Actinomycetota bacterium]|nr:ESX secretion-associated protein EspG [Actinomycetota bacterium]